MRLTLFIPGEPIAQPRVKARGRNLDGLLAGMPVSERLLPERLLPERQPRQEAAP